MKRQRLQPVAMAVGLVLLFALMSVSGCRGGEGEDCLTDSDCKLGLLCLKRIEEIDGQKYEERWGTCYEDGDEDGIPDDGDLSGGNFDRRCGVHVFLHPDFGTETVQERVVGECDDNCADVANSWVARRFVCFAQDDCCPISDERKEDADQWDVCADLTDEVDSCKACFTGSPASPETCYFQYAGGYDLDSDGCLHCRPLEDLVSCTREFDEEDNIWNDSCDDAVAGGQLPTPACSGAWQCDRPTGGTCEFIAEQVVVEDDQGYTVLFQYDTDWDGLGDECDNCPTVPNGVECESPSFEKRCDVNQDGNVAPYEKELGDQANRDGDPFGDACDLCPDLATSDNRDLDFDGLGDGCDPDDDGDTIDDEEDNCPGVANQDQNDLDMDGEGDLCDSDRDGDGVREDGDSSGVAGDNFCTGGTNRNCDDNCPTVANQDQADADSDGIGDVCD